MKKNNKHVEKQTGAKRPVSGRNVQGAKRPGSETSWGRNVQGTKRPGGAKRPGGPKRPGGETSSEGAKRQRGETSCYQK